MNNPPMSPLSPHNQYQPFSSTQMSPHRDSFRCPSCNTQAQTLKYYKCCLQPSCKNCYQGFHLLQCKKNRDREGNQSSKNSSYNTEQLKQFEGSPFSDKNTSTKSKGSPHKKSLKRRKDENNYYFGNCSSCEIEITEGVYTCSQCSNQVFCKLCYNSLHSKGKFTTHKPKLREIVANKSNILVCDEHRKQRTVISEALQLVCSECVSQYKIRKLKTIDNKTNLEQPKQKINILLGELKEKEMNHQNKWKQLRSKIQQEYCKIQSIIQQKYENCLTILDKIIASEAHLFQDTKKLCDKTLLEIQFTPMMVGTTHQMIINTRMHLIIQELIKKKRVIKSTQNFGHKIGEIDQEKLQNILKSFCIQKFKVKEDDTREKQNSSSRKSQHSMSKNKNNLSSSRKSFGSVSKLNDSRVSLKSITKNSGEQNSSGKKSLINQQRNSMLCSKVQEIEPMALNFDNKQINNRSRITFLYSRTENTQKNLQDISDTNSISASICTRKRKSDYYDLRQRMRKPSMVNNRFSKK